MTPASKVELNMSFLCPATFTNIESVSVESFPFIKQDAADTVDYHFTSLLPHPASFRQQYQHNAGN